MMGPRKPFGCGGGGDRQSILLESFQSISYCAARFTPVGSLQIARQR